MSFIGRKVDNYVLGSYQAAVEVIGGLDFQGVRISDAAGNPVSSFGGAQAVSTCYEYTHIVYKRLDQIVASEPGRIGGWLHNVSGNLLYFTTKSEPELDPAYYFPLMNQQYLKFSDFGGVLWTGEIYMYSPVVETGMTVRVIQMGTIAAPDGPTQLEQPEGGN